MPQPRKFIVREINHLGQPINPGPGDASFNDQDAAVRDAQRRVDNGPNQKLKGTGEVVVYQAVEIIRPTRRYDRQTLSNCR